MLLSPSSLPVLAPAGEFIFFACTKKTNQKKHAQFLRLVKGTSYPHHSLKTGLLRNSRKKTRSGILAENSLFLTRSSAQSMGPGKSKSKTEELSGFPVLTFLPI